MSNKILVTDSLFIGDAHVKVLQDAGYEVERLDKPHATEEELCQAIKGKVGYILGGVEKVTDKVIESADELKAIIFTGTSWQGYILAGELATKKGIAICSAPYFNAKSVAEFGVSMSLLLTRDMLSLARGGAKTFETTRSIADLTIGVAGLGHIGTEYVRMLQGFGVKQALYFNRSQKPDLEKDLNLSYVDKHELFKQSDLVFVALPVSVGKSFFTTEDINALKPGSLTVSVSEPEQFDLEALYKRLTSAEIRSAFDEHIPDEKLQKLPLDVLYSPNANVGYNTFKSLNDTSNSCVKTLINVLQTGDDQYLMNPEYKQNK